jgi:hypothetical protein
MFYDSVRRLLGSGPKRRGADPSADSRLEERLARLRLEHREFDPLSLAPPERRLLDSRDQTRASFPVLTPASTPANVTKTAVQLAAVTGPTLASVVSEDVPEGSIALNTAPLGTGVTPGFTLLISTSRSPTIAAAGSVSVIDGSNPVPSNRTITLSTLAEESAAFSAGRDEGSCVRLAAANLTEDVLLPILGAIGGTPAPLDPHETSGTATTTARSIAPPARDGCAMASDLPLTAAAILDGDSCSRFVARSWLPAAGFEGGPLFHLAGLNGFSGALSHAPGDQALPRTVVITVTPPLPTSTPSHPSSSTRSE